MTKNDILNNRYNINIKNNKNNNNVNNHRSRSKKKKTKKNVLSNKMLSNKMLSNKIFSLAGFIGLNRQSVSSRRHQRLDRNGPYLLHDDDGGIRRLSQTSAYFPRSHLQSDSQRLIFHDGSKRL